MVKGPMPTVEQGVKLTSLSSCAGCASKLSRQSLTEVLRQIPVLQDRNVLVGTATGDDAGVYRLDSKRALVQTTDFFTPIVDDPYWYGQISATNALSDVYAMGGRPLTALNLVGIPTDVVSLEIVNEIVRGGAEKIREAQCVLIGGHTIKIPEPVFGYAITGIVSPHKMLTNSRARPGDMLVLTKPIGTGIITTAIKRGLATPELEKKAIDSMTRLNTVGADIAERGLVRAAVDVTGFGLVSHLGAMCASSKVSAEINAASVPAIASEVFDLIAAGCIPGGSRDNLAYANEFTDWGEAGPVQKTLLTDAQTSGGLLLCVPRKNEKAVMKLLEKAQILSAAVIGSIVRAAKPRIRVRA
jgi:selenide,water dikinase